ncbi:MAG: hypothetical protein IPH93_17280 [Saprospiraceae bacterium]|nr:hypothetical protein [Saprospiraceae bacterium]
MEAGPTIWSIVQISVNAGDPRNKAKILFDENNIPWDALGGFGWYLEENVVNPKILTTYIFWE